MRRHSFLCKNGPDRGDRKSGVCVVLVMRTGDGHRGAWGGELAELNNNASLANPLHRGA
jgi:hypothetical protein